MKIETIGLVFLRAARLRSLKYIHTRDHHLFQVTGNSRPSAMQVKAALDSLSSLSQGTDFTIVCSELHSNRKVLRQGVIDFTYNFDLSVSMRQEVFDFACEFSFSARTLSLLQLNR